MLSIRFFLIFSLYVYPPKTSQHTTKMPPKHPQTPPQTPPKTPPNTPKKQILKRYNNCSPPSRLGLLDFLAERFSPSSSSSSSSSLAFERKTIKGRCKWNGRHFTIGGDGSRQCPSESLVFLELFFIKGLFLDFLKFSSGKVREIRTCVFFFLFLEKYAK